MSTCRAPRTVMSPPVASAARAQLAASSRSVIGRWEYPRRRGTPSISMTRSVCTLMTAPIFCSTQIRSTISGSTAALRSSVTPSARTAVSSTCSVAPTLGYGSSNLVPCRPLGAVRCSPPAVLSTTAPNCRSAARGKSIGRSPMWQPPSSGMKAWPRRCSSGPQNRVGIRLDPACTLISSAVAVPTFAGSNTNSPRPSSVTCTPCSSSRPRTTSTSRTFGTSNSRLGVSPSSVATIVLETRFLAPRTLISPRSGTPPCTVRTSFGTRTSSRGKSCWDGRDSPGEHNHKTPPARYSRDENYVPLRQGQHLVKSDPGEMRGNRGNGDPVGYPPGDQFLQRPDQVGQVDPVHRRAIADRPVEEADLLVRVGIGQPADQVELGADRPLRAGRRRVQRPDDELGRADQIGGGDHLVPALRMDEHGHVRDPVSDPGHAIQGEPPVYRAVAVPQDHRGVAQLLVGQPAARLVRVVEHAVV